MKTKLIGISLLIVIFSACCREDDDPPKIKEEPPVSEYNPTPYSLQLPSYFNSIPAPFIPEDNPLTVEGKNDSVDIPLNINVAQNQEPDFVAACENSCSLAETAPSGTVISNSLS